MAVTRPVGVIEDSRFREHRAPSGHPERPERLTAVHEAIAERADALLRRTPRAAEDDELLRVHDRAHLEHVKAAVARAPARLDADTYVSAESLAVARLAAGSAVDLALDVASGALRSGFAAVRPPGHHAEPDRAMGFCLFNNVAVAARALQQQAGMSRILIVDWDVHHGNGTQHSFSREPGVLFVSTHRWPFYPGTGALDEDGEGDGRGFTVNLPFPGGFGDAEYAEAFDAVVAPLALEYEPQLILISAGFDPHRRDPLGGMAVSEAGFAAMARSLCAVAERVCDGRVVAVLEGGYDLRATRDSAEAVLDVLCGRVVPPPPPAAPSHAGPLIEAVKRQHGDQWHSL